MKTPMYTKKGVSCDTHPLETGNILSNAASNLRSHWYTNLVNIGQFPFSVALTGQVGVIVDRLNIRELFQPEKKRRSTHPQAFACLLSSQYTALLFFAHSYPLRLVSIISLDNCTVNTYNMYDTYRTYRT